MVLSYTLFAMCCRSSNEGATASVGGAVTSACSPAGGVALRHLVNVDVSVLVAECRKCWLAAGERNTRMKATVPGRTDKRRASDQPTEQDPKEHRHVGEKATTRNADD